MFINGKDTVPVLYMDKLKRHFGCAFHGIFCTAGRTKAAVTAEGNVFHFTTVWAAIHGTTIGAITTVDHLINVVHFTFAWM